VRDACSSELFVDSKQRKFGEISKILNNFLKKDKFAVRDFPIFYGFEDKMARFSQTRRLLEMRK
jgi:hypothetical protein